MQYRFKQVFAMLLLVLMSSFVSVQAQEGSIAVLLPDSASSARWENDDRRFLSAAFDAAGVEYNIVNAEGDAATQLTQAEQAITNGARVILMVNLDSGSGAQIIELARAAGVSVIDYDRLTIEGPGADFYVSFDNESVGRLQGEGLVAAVEAAGLENPRVAVLNGSPTDNNATLFANGYNGVITPLFDSGEWTLVDNQSVPDWDNQQALVIFEQMLTAAGGGIDAAIAANDGLAGSVIAALENQGLAYIPVTGQDATVGGIQNILAGRQSMTVYKAIKAQAEAAAALAVAILNGEDTSAVINGVTNNGTSDVPSILLVPVSVTIDNIAETVIADGFRTWAEICVGDFEQFCPEGWDSMSMMAEGSIAVLLPDSASSARWENDDRRFLSAAFDAAGVDYSIVNAEGDAATQLTQAEQAITNGARVILMVNLDSGSGAQIIELARAAGVAVIDYDRLTIEGPGADFYVSFDNEAVGRLQGEGLVAAVEAAGLANPRVAVLNGSPTDNNATLFANGYNSVITPLFDNGTWTLVDNQSVPDWDNQQALVIFEQMLTASGGGIDAAIAANDGLAGSVIAALENQGLAYIPVTGQDATVGGIQNILAGRQSMTVYKAIKAQAEAAASLAIAILNGEDTSAFVNGVTNNGTSDVPSILLVPVSVTSENIRETVIADGFRTWEEICVGDFEQFCPPADQR
jgi:D-xylose transport system substrate-binding protein